MRPVNLPCLLTLALTISLWFCGIPSWAQQSATYKIGQSKLVAPGLMQQVNKSGQQAVRVQVKNKARFLAWLDAQKYSGSIGFSSERIITLSNISPELLQQLATCPEVSYIDKPTRRATVEAELKDADFAVNKVYAAWGAYPQLNGESMAVSLKEASFDPQDIDLKGRVLHDVAAGQDPHATTMATIIAGAGNSGPKGKGVASHAKIASSDFVNLMPDNSQQLLSQGIYLQNHSYGVGLENYYGLESEAYDTEVYQHPTLLHIFSSGNSGDKGDAVGNYAGLTGFANLTGQFKTTKNTLSVGALDMDGTVGVKSSKGPAYDGRIKPELVAHGIGGTSEAAAEVSGIALLAQQAYKNLHDNLPPASLVKAALINSADDVGRPNVDFGAGFGNTDALGAIRTITENRFIVGTLTDKNTQRHTITVPQGARKLKVTLVWHEAAAAPEATQALINDLDLTLATPTGQLLKPWVLSHYPHPDSLTLPAKRRTDRLNNIEQVTLDLPAAGSYELQVYGFSVPQGPQNYSIAYEFETAPEWTYPVAGTTLQAGQTNRIYWQNVPAGQNAKLEYKLSTDTEWQLIAENTDLEKTYFDWNTPDVISKAKLRLTNGSETITSGEFILSKQLKLQVGYSCGETTLLHWPALPHVEQYQLYQVGATHLEPLFIVSDTLALLNSSQSMSGFITMAPIIQGSTAQVTESINYKNSSTGCYIRSFIPQQFIDDNIQLQLELGTLYQLASVTLERQVKGNYTDVQTIDPVTELAYTLTDPTPALGRNLYRVKVTTTSGQVYYSHTEEMLYADKNFVQAYPNPVAAGEMLSVAVASETAIIRVYDQLGKLVYQAEEFGMIKEVPTANLHKGLYILRVETESGNHLAGKVLVL